MTDAILHGSRAANKREPRRAGSLVARNISVRFGEITALEAVTLEVAPGEILGLIGPNGAGKTTLVNVLSGVQPPTEGSVWIAERDITQLAVSKRAQHGLARTFQSARLFAALTVAENLEVYASTIHRSRAKARELVAELLEAGDLKSVADTRASALPQGLERRVALMRSLALRPSHLLLDEPAAGLDDVETDEMERLISSLSTHFGCGVLLIEHDMRLIMRACHRIHVLNYGRTLSVGTPAEVAADPEVRAAYLGGRAETPIKKASGGSK
jgi:ABC-type branched-subunit amino acid transport system ATPase component